MADIKFEFIEPIVVPTKVGLWVHPHVKIEADQPRIIGCYYDVFADGSMSKNATDFMIQLTPEDLAQLLQIFMIRATEQGVLRPSTPVVNFDVPTQP